MFRTAALFVFAAFASVSLVAADPQPAICNGNGFGVTQDFHVGDTHHVNVYHNDCDLAQSFSSDSDNGVCAEGSALVCSPPPSPYSSFTFNDVTYACHVEPNAGSCAGIPIAACCHND